MRHLRANDTVSEIHAAVVAVVALRQVRGHSHAARSARIEWLKRTGWFRLIKDAKKEDLHRLSVVCTEQMIAANLCAPSSSHHDVGIYRLVHFFGAARG
jgi:tRNA threonylcarbamoyladenosine modification (KEOPS) complex Cgi121 subunit